MCIRIKSIRYTRFLLATLEKKLESLLQIYSSKFRHKYYIEKNGITLSQVTKIWYFILSSWSPFPKATHWTDTFPKYLYFELMFISYFTILQFHISRNSQRPFIFRNSLFSQIVFYISTFLPGNAKIIFYKLIIK